MDTRGLTYELRLKTYDALLRRYHALYVKEFARGGLNDEEFEKIKQMFVEACHMAKALLQDFVKRSTAPYKYPRIVEFVDELPKTHSGKIRRAEIRRRDLDEEDDD